MRDFLFSIPILLLQAYSGQAQPAKGIVIRAVEYNDAPEGAPLTHFTVQVDVVPATGAGYTLTQSCDSLCVFDDLPKGSTLVFTAAKEDLPDDHVGTYDLVIISRHINKEVGRNVYSVRQPAQAGAQQVELPAGVFPVAGVYFWRMVSGSDKASGKIVRR